MITKIDPPNPLDLLEIIEIYAAEMDEAISLLRQTRDLLDEIFHKHGMGSWGQQVYNDVDNFLYRHKE